MLGCLLCAWAWARWARSMYDLTPSATKWGLILRESALKWLQNINYNFELMWYMHKYYYYKPACNGWFAKTRSNSCLNEGNDDKLEKQIHFAAFANIPSCKFQKNAESTKVWLLTPQKGSSKDPKGSDSAVTTSNNWILIFICVLINSEKQRKLFIRPQLGAQRWRQEISTNDKS